MRDTSSTTDDRYDGTTPDEAQEIAEEIASRPSIKDYHTRNRPHDPAVDGDHFDSPKYDPENAAAREAEAQADLDAKRELAAWLNQQEWSSFAKSLAEQFYRKGMAADSLSEKQWAAAEKMKATCDAKAAARAEKASRPETGIDLTPIPSGYYAVPEGTTRLKVRINHVEKGRWAGYTFVDDGAEYGNRRNYGRQAPDGTYQGDIADALKAIAADPEAASTAYGKLVGRCGICNRQLEDAESIERGIGPVCAGKVGW
jgi:hypothetical protein